MIDITGLDKADVLAALYNAARPQGMGFLDFDPEPMTREVAAEMIDQQRPPYFDYVKGRVMKVHIEGDTLEERLYDRDNGRGAADRALAPLRTKP